MYVPEFGTNSEDEQIIPQADSYVPETTPRDTDAYVPAPPAPAPASDPATAPVPARPRSCLEAERESTSDDGAYPGYTGPRCYAPGGNAWKPC